MTLGGEPTVLEEAFFWILICTLETDLEVKTKVLIVSFTHVN